jgi:hypothetical protein
MLTLHVMLCTLLVKQHQQLQLAPSAANSSQLRAAVNLMLLAG